VIAYYIAIAEQFTNHDFSFLITIGERRNDHDVVVQGVLAMPSHVLDRQRTVHELWEKLDDNTYFITQKSCVHADFPAVKSTVRMTTTRLFKLTNTSSKSTPLEAVASMHLGGSFPASLNNFFAIPIIESSPVSRATCFAAFRAADAFDESEATQLGQWAKRLRRGSAVESVRESLRRMSLGEEEEEEEEVAVT